MNYFSESPNNTILTMSVFNDELYVGGIFNEVGGVLCQNIAKYAGGNWYALDNSLNGIVTSFVSYQNKLYIGGMFSNEDTLNPIYSIAYLESDILHRLDESLLGGVLTMEVYNDELYVGGMLEMAGDKEIFNIVKWNGSNWIQCDSGVLNFQEDKFVSSLKQYKNELMIFGRFNICNNITCNNFAKYRD